MDSVKPQVCISTPPFTHSLRFYVMTTVQNPEAFYRDRFSGSLFVIKAGGRIITDDKARLDLLKTIKDFTSADIKVLLVYGGGHAIDTALKDNNIETVKKDGRRITNAKSIPVIQSVMSGYLSGLILKTMACVGFKSGLCLPALPAHWTEIELRPRDKKDYGFDGTIPKVHAAPILSLLNCASFLATPSLATSQNNAVNINADMAAISIACWTQARKLIFLSDVDGVMINDEKSSVLTDDDIRTHIQDGQIKGGMKVKMESCLQALDRGVRRVHLINGLKENSLAKEIYDPIGTGTMILRESDKDRYMEEIKFEDTV